MHVRSPVDPVGKQGIFPRDFGCASSKILHFELNVRSTQDSLQIVTYC